MKFQAAARAIRGSKDVQEDAFRVFDARGTDASEGAAGDAGVALSGGGLLLVADGIGGHYGGDVASAITADNFVKTFFAIGGDAEERLRTSLNAANQAVADAQQREPGLKDMGATLVAGLLEDETMAFVSIGDSLILRFRDGELHRVNMDHSYMEIADREALGSGDPALWRDVMTRKGRDSITIAVLGRSLEDFGHRPEFAKRKVLPGDVLIFASDGIETLSMVQIQNFVRELLPRGVAAVADGLIKAVDGIGGNRNYQDNATLVVAQAEGGQAARTVLRETESAKTISTPPQTATASKAPTGAISASARSGRWSPAKLVIVCALIVMGAAAFLFASGKASLFGVGQAKVERQQLPQEKGLLPQPELSPESDSQVPKRRAPEAPQGASPNQGGSLDRFERNAQLLRYG